MRYRQIVTLSAVLVMVTLPSAAYAAQRVKLSASFDPNKLGAISTVTTSFAIETPNGELPSPVSQFDLRLPAGVSIGASSLGIATCDPQTLALRGIGSCSPESQMGRGMALVGIRFGPEIVYERAQVTLLMAPERAGHTQMLFYAVGASPVIAQLIFPSLLLGDTGVFGGRLDTNIEPIVGFPGGPSGAVVKLTSSIGPRGIKYYKHDHGRLVAYTPEGFSEPTECPRGGFQFAANFTFLDGTKQTATAVAPCPKRH